MLILFTLLDMYIHMGNTVLFCFIFLTEILIRKIEKRILGGDIFVCMLSCYILYIYSY